jgi:hypothetical protein
MIGAYLSTGTTLPYQTHPYSKYVRFVIWLHLSLSEGRSDRNQTPSRVTVIIFNINYLVAKINE